MFRNFVCGSGGRNLLLSRNLKSKLTNPPRSIYYNCERGSSALPKEPKKPEKPKPRFRRMMSDKFRVIIIKNKKEDDNYEGLKSLLLVSSITLAIAAFVGLGYDETQLIEKTSKTTESLDLVLDLLKREGVMTPGRDGETDVDVDVNECGCRARGG